MTASRPQGRAGLKFLLLLIVVVVLAAAAAGWWGWQRYHAFAAAPLEGLGDDATVMVERGDSFPTVIRKLREAGVEAGDDLEWRLLARQLGADARLHVGEYVLREGMTPRELLQAMSRGDTVQHRFTIVEGWNIRELRTALARAEVLRQETEDLDDAALMESLGRAGEHPEGRFLPETYAFTRGDSDLDVLARAAQAMDSALAAAWESRDPEMPLETPYEMLTLASIVEKETGIAGERPQIAGLFLRRLRIGMRLQTDPTVIYGIGEDYDGNIRRVHLTTDTPYNTYTRDGLPPTPIAMPGRAALQAVASPQEGTALYFVAVGDGSGRHLFADSYAEHQANVRRYLRNYREYVRGMEAEEQ